METKTSVAPKREGSLARVLASRALADVVAYFVLFPDAAPHFRALQRATGTATRSLQHELARLEELGMIERQRDGRLVRYRAVAGHPRWSVLRDVIREFAEPAELLRVALASVPGIEAAFIFGSFARGDVHPESDVDVFVLGDELTDLNARLELSGATLEVSGLLGREVNPVTYTRGKLEARRTGGFLRSVLGGPKKWLSGTPASLERAGGPA